MKIPFWRSKRESDLEKANPELRKMVVSLPPNAISPVIHTQEGYRILKVITKEPAGQRELNDPRVQQSIRETLINSKNNLLQAAYYELLERKRELIEMPRKCRRLDNRGDVEIHRAAALAEPRRGAGRAQAHPIGNQHARQPRMDRYAANFSAERRKPAGSINGLQRKQQFPGGRNRMRRRRFEPIKCR